MRRHFASVVLIAASAALYPGQVTGRSHDMPRGAKSDEALQFSSALRKAVERYSIAIMYDLPERPVAVPVRDGMTALSWLKMTTAVNDRVLIEADGTYVLIRPDRPPGSPLEGDRLEILGLLNRLGDAQLNEALEGRLTMGDLAPADRAILMRNMMNWSGSHSFNPASEHAEEQLAAHALTGAGAVIEIALNPKYTAEIASGRSYSIGNAKDGFRRGEGHAEPIPQPTNSERATPARLGLPLDFGEGEAMSVAELLRRANRELDKRYRLDGRVLDDLVFVSGSYDAESFDKAAQTLLRLRALQDSPTADESLAALQTEFARRVHSLVPSDRITEDKSIALSELRVEDGWVADYFMNRLGLADDAEVNVSQGFRLNIHAGPPIESGTGFIVVDGERRPMPMKVSSSLTIYF